MRARTVALLAVVVATASAQPVTRRATNLAAILAFPGFYQQRALLIVGAPATDDKGDRRVSDDGGSVRVVFKGTAPDGVDEVRGEYWDLGRMKADDPRLAGIDLRATFHVDPDAG